MQLKKVYMKFNPLTKTLYTDDNKLIKKMYCPYTLRQWSDFSAGNYRYFGDKASIYVYKNRNNIPIRSYNRAINRIGPIFGVYTCR